MDSQKMLEQDFIDKKYKLIEANKDIKIYQIKNGRNKSQINKNREKAKNQNSSLAVGLQEPSRYPSR